MRMHHIAIIGAGRMGRALTNALRVSGRSVSGPHGRGFDAAEADAAILCVPDAEIAAAAACVAEGPLVGHVSGATGLGVLGEREAFSLHPLMTVTGGGSEGASPFAGAGAAVAGTTPRALAFARELADDLGMTAFEVRDEDRAAYHAAASIASNYLVALEAAAERVLGDLGDRRLLAPLVRATVANWERLGAREALTGPIARADEDTVTRQRDAVADRAPELLSLFDVLAGATRALARGAPGGMGLTTVRTVADVRAAVAARPRPVGLVPTMGALHEGHLALIRAARAECATVVVSLFVNPRQFDDATDLATYPRDETRDAILAHEAGADVLYAPPVEEVYPEDFSTTVSVGGVSAPMEGAARGRAHFDGVATVVLKLLNAVGPDVAFFGQKDAQQAVVIRRLVRDLDVPVRIVTVPTVREPDGLALSSRNVRLQGDERKRALALSRALRAAERAVTAGERDARAVRAAAREAMQPFEVEPEYLELVSPENLTPVTTLEGNVLVAVAARVGTTRLIDNILIHADGRP